MTYLKVPKGLFGLPIPDLALVLFTFFSLMAVPILILYTDNTKQKDKL